MLQEQDGLFYKMVQQVGKTEAASLMETAKRVILGGGIMKFVSAVCLSRVSIFNVVVSLLLKNLWALQGKAHFSVGFL